MYITWENKEDFIFYVHVALNILYIIMQIMNFFFIINDCNFFYHIINYNNMMKRVVNLKIFKLTYFNILLITSKIIST